MWSKGPRQFAHVLRNLHAYGKNWFEKFLRYSIFFVHFNRPEQRTVRVDCLLNAVHTVELMSQGSSFPFQVRIFKAEALTGLGTLVRVISVG